MATFRPEGLRRLPGERPPGQVDDRAGEHHRDARAARLEDLGDGEEGGLRVERVEDGLDEQDVGAAVEQALDLRPVGAGGLGEGEGAVAGVVDVGRERERLVERPDGTADPARALGRSRTVGSLAGDAGGRGVELVHERVVGEAVVRLRDGRAVERVRLDQVGPGGEVLPRGRRG